MTPLEETMLIRLRELAGPPLSKPDQRIIVEASKMLKRVIEERDRAMGLELDP
jgi:hypothetical protein